MDFCAAGSCEALTVVAVCKVEFSVRSGGAASTAIKELRLIGLGNSFGDIDVLPINCSTRTLPRKVRTGLCRSFSERMPTLEIHTSILRGSHLDAEHIILILLASGVAACGLLQDSAVLILASFFIQIPSQHSGAFNISSERL